jgi:crotonobetainyl-CoA:carnitine CoA-transferase CaiB-like acyl-CoA transferase
MNSLNLKILDFTTLLPGPFATMMLGDMGADVVRVEAPGRWDMVRSRPPFDDGVAAGHAFLARNKRSVALDLKKPGAAEVVKRLVQTYDIVIEQFRPGVMDRLGIGYETLAKENPRLIYCSLTGYGQTGPLRDRAGHDNNYLSLAGVMSHCGRKESGPVPQGVQVADIGGGSMCSVIGILAAVVCRQQTGRGQYVDVSMYDASILWNAYAAAQYLVGGVAPDYEGMPLNGGTHYDYYRTKDGRYISVGSLEPKFWEGFCRAIGRPDFIERVDLPGPKMDALKIEIRAVMAQKTFGEWVAIFATEDVCVEPVLRMDEALQHPQCAAREMVVSVPKPKGGTQRQVGFPIKFSELRPGYKHIGCEMGEHTDEVLQAAGYTGVEIATMRAAGTFG